MLGEPLSAVPAVTRARRRIIFLALSASPVPLIGRVDTDAFKAGSDRSGHAEGDSLLRTVVGTMLGSLRAPDIAARAGGDELAAPLPETDAERAREAVDRLRERLSQALTERGWPVTLSVGAVSFDGPPSPVDELIREADDLTYSVRGGGKDGARREAWRPSAGGPAPPGTAGVA